MLLDRRLGAPQASSGGLADGPRRLVGPGECIPLIDGGLGLSRWQNIFFCEFDGPRTQRSVVCTVIADTTVK